MLFPQSFSRNKVGHLVWSARKCLVGIYNFIAASAQTGPMHTSAPSMEQQVWADKTISCWKCKWQLIVILISFRNFFSARKVPSAKIFPHFTVAGYADMLHERDTHDQDAIQINGSVVAWSSFAGYHFCKKGPCGLARGAM